MQSNKKGRKKQEAQTKIREAFEAEKFSHENTKESHAYRGVTGTDLGVILFNQTNGRVTTSTVLRHEDTDSKRLYLLRAVPKASHSGQEPANYRLCLISTDPEEGSTDEDAILLADYAEKLTATEIDHIFKAWSEKANQYGWDIYAEKQDPVSVPANTNRKITP